MGCDKRYGLREVWVAPEASPNTPATFADTNYLQHCTATSFPAVYRENLENGEATGNRGQSLAFDGAQNELAWDVTVMIPSNAYVINPSSWPESLQALFWAAGFGSATGPSSWVPGGAVTMGMTAGSACGRTIQLVGLDRDKRQLELLLGAVVSQVVFSFSRSDVCTIQFSGVAAQKYEAVAPEIAVADIGNTSFSYAHVRSSFGADLPYSPAVITGVSLTLPGASAELQSIAGSTDSITLKTSLSGATITSTTQSFWSLPKPVYYYDILSPDDWSVSSTIQSVQSATFTIETGQSYGELTTAAQYPSEILSGQVKVSASVSAYLVDNNAGVLVYDSGAGFNIFFTPTGTGALLGMTRGKLTEYPALDLASVDDAATGDFNLQAGEAGTLASFGFLDTVFIN